MRMSDWSSDVCSSDLPIGTGSVDNAAIVRTALAAGYRGRIGVEAFSRSILPAFVADLLAIWREPYSDGLQLAADAITLIRDAEAGRAPWGERRGTYV